MNSRLVSRLIAPVAGLSVLLLATAVAAAWYVDRQQRSSADLLQNYVASIRSAQELEISLRAIRTQINRYLVAFEPHYLEPVPAMRLKTEVAMQTVARTAMTDQEVELMERTRKGYDHFFDEFDEIQKNPDPAQYTRFLALIDRVLIKEILEPVHEYVTINEQMLADSTQANRDLSRRVTLGMIALGVCGSIGGILAGTVIAVAVRRSIAQTETQLHSTAEQLDQAAFPGRIVKNGRVHPDAVERMARSASAVLERLRHTEREVLRAEQLAWAGQMAAGIAHEIRNPLMAIKLLVQATAERLEGASFRPRDFRVLEDEIVRLERIVSGFLDFARPPRPETRLVDVRELVRSTVDSIRPKADLQGVQIRVDGGDSPLTVTADPNQLRQVLLNLLINALDAQPDGGTITVHPRQTGTELELTVEDRGSGLPPEIGERIFEPFVSTKESGMGLGLSICRRIAELHGGSLTATPNPEVGATFTLRIPVPPTKTPTEGSLAETAHRR